MQLRQKYLKIIPGLLVTGAVGTMTLLGLALPASASERPAGTRPLDDGETRVSDRLDAIREAVFTVISPENQAIPKDENFRLVWGNRWANVGWGPRPGWRRPAWNNWRNGWPNWNNFWRNW